MESAFAGRRPAPAAVQAAGICAAMAACAVLTWTYGGSGAAFTFTLFCIYFCIGTCLIFMEKWPADERMKVFWAFAAAFFIRYACAQYLFPYFVEHSEFYFSDSIYYERIGRHLALGWPDNPITNTLRFSYIKVMGNSDGFYILSALHLMVQDSVHPISATDAFLSAITAYFIYRVARRCAPPGGSSKSALIAAWAFALFPASIFWSSVYMKESVSMFLVFLLFDGFCSVLSKKTVSGLVEIVAGAVGMLHVRNYVVILFVLSCLFSICIMALNFGKYRRMLFLSLGFIGTVLCMAVATGLFNKIYLIKQLLAKGLVQMVLDAPTGGLSMLQGKAFTSPVAMLKSLPTMVPLIVLFPLPRFSNDMLPTEICIRVCNIFWLLMLPFSLAGAWEALRRAEFVKTGTIAFFTLALIATLALTQLTSARQTTSLIPCYCFFAAYGFANWRRVMPFAFVVYFGLIAFTGMRDDVSPLMFAPLLAVCAAGLALYLLISLPKPARAHWGGRRARS